MIKNLPMCLCKFKITICFLLLNKDKQIHCASWRISENKILNNNNNNNNNNKD